MRQEPWQASRPGAHARQPRDQSHNAVLIEFKPPTPAHGTPEHWETEQFLWVTYEELVTLHPKHFGLEELLLNSGNLLNEFALSYKLS